MSYRPPVLYNLRIANEINPSDLDSGHSWWVTTYDPKPRSFKGYLSVDRRITRNSDGVVTSYIIRTVDFRSTTQTVQPFCDIIPSGTGFLRALFYL